MNDVSSLVGPVEVIGTGLLGTSIALACRRAGIEVLLTDRSPEHLRTASGLGVDDFISVIFTATSDLVSEFPAYAARRLGFGDVPLLCARELEIDGSMPRVVRMLAHVETDLPRAEITHVYLHGAALLRTDLTRVRSVPDE